MAVPLGTGGGNITNTPNETTGIWGNLTSDGFSNFGTGMQGIASIANIGTNIYGLWQTNRALNMQKKALGMAEKQNAIENERWDKREAERVNANAQIAAAAKTWNEQTPFNRN